MRTDSTSARLRASAVLAIVVAPILTGLALGGPARAQEPPNGAALDFKGFLDPVNSPATEMTVNCLTSDGRLCNDVTPTQGTVTVRVSSLWKTRIKLSPAVIDTATIGPFGGSNRAASITPSLTVRNKLKAFNARYPNNKFVTGTITLKLTSPRVATERRAVKMAVKNGFTPYQIAFCTDGTPCKSRFGGAVLLDDGTSVGGRSSVDYTP